MTITTNPTRDEYQASAGQDVFTYTFRIFTETDLNVYVTPAGQECDDQTDLVTPSAVTGVGDPNGGTVTIPTPANDGDLITIVSDIPAERTTDYQNNGDFRPETVNEDFDRVVSLVKQVEELSNRTLVSKECQQGPKPLSLPAPQPGFLMRWNADSSGMDNVQSADLDGVDFLSQELVKVLPTVAAMKADLTLQPGQRTRTQGYHTPGDGGGADYLISASQAVDEFGDHTLDNGNVALIETGLINVKQVGAVGDGVTDDTDAIRAACERAGADAVVYFPAGDYRVTGQINLNGGRNFVGESRNTTVIEIDDALLDNTTAILADFVNSIRDLTFRGTSSNATGFRVKRPSGGSSAFLGWITVDKVNFFSLGRAMWFDNVFTFVYRDGRIENGVDGIYVDAVDQGGDDGYVTDSLFENIFINANSGYALYFFPDEKSPTWTFTNCAFQSTSLDNPYIVDVGPNADPIVFNNCYFEGDGGSVALARVSGRSNFFGGYDNSVKGFDLGTQTVDMLVTGFKCTGQSAGFFGGSGNTNIVFINHLQSTGIPTGNFVKALKSTFGANVYDDFVIGTQADIDYSNAREILLSSNTKISAATNPLIRSNITKTGIGVAGAAVDVFTVTTSSGTNQQVALIVPYCVVCRSVGVQRQIITGSLIISAINVSGTWAVSFQDTFGKAVPIGTLNDPVWSQTNAGNTVTVKLAITSSLEDSILYYGISNHTGITADNLTITAV